MKKKIVEWQRGIAGITSNQVNKHEKGCPEGAYTAGFGEGRDEATRLAAAKTSTLSGPHPL